MRTGSEREVDRSRTWRRLVVVSVATAAFAAALLLQDTVNLWAVTGGAALVSLAAAAWADGRRLAALLVPRRHDVLLGLATGAAAVLATHLLFALAARLAPGLPAAVRQLYAGLEAPPGPLAALPVTALVVLAEEVVWRGLLVDELVARLGTAPARRATAARRGDPALRRPPPRRRHPSPPPRRSRPRRRPRHPTPRHRRPHRPLLCHLVWSTAVFAIWPLA